MAINKNISYNHFGKPADVWKHINICEIIKYEKPRIYIETNSACADYALNHTPEQLYGIYYFLREASVVKDLSSSSYFNIEYSAMKQERYLGSPGLAMTILKGAVNKFVFYDIEYLVLENILDFADNNKLSDKVEVVCQDSIIGMTERLSELSDSAFIHIDPYNIDKLSTNGNDYLDIFVKASEKGAKCFLWYGFNTLDEKSTLNTFIKNKLTNKNIQNVCCIELIMEIIRKDSVLCNPGVLGSGVLTSNLSEKSTDTIEKYSNLFVDIYKGSVYNEFRGDIYCDIVI